PAPAPGKRRHPPRCSRGGSRPRSSLGGGFATGLCRILGGALLRVLLVLLLILGQFALAFLERIIGLCHLCSRDIEHAVYVVMPEARRNGRRIREFGVHMRRSPPISLLLRPRSRQRRSCASSSSPRMHGGPRPRPGC